MQKKQLYLVLGLAGATVLALQIANGNVFNRFATMRMGDMGGAMGSAEEMVMMEAADSYMPLGGGTAATSKIAIEPSIGIMPPYYGDDALDVQERSYEKSSYHSVVVDDVPLYLRGMKEYFASIDGIILNSSMGSSDKYDSGSLYVRVPVDKFDEATTRVTEDVEKVVDESISAYDVTGQVVNTQENLQYLRDQRSLKEAELSEAQTEVEKRRIQIEIDRLDRQIRNAEQAQENVESRVEYASLSVTAASSERYFNPDATGDIRYEFERAWESLKSFFKVALLFGVWVLVYSVVWLPIVWIGNWIVKRVRK